MLPLMRNTLVLGQRLEADLRMPTRAAMLCLRTVRGHHPWIVRGPAGSCCTSARKAARTSSATAWRRAWNSGGTKARCTMRKKRRGKYSTARREDPPPPVREAMIASQPCVADGLLLQSREATGNGRKPHGEG